VCKLRIAVNTRRKNGATGEWVDQPNFFNVTVFGGQGESCAKFLAKGRPVAIDGRLEWREWEKDGQKRSAVEIVADSVQFLGDGKSGERQDDKLPNGTTRNPSDIGAFKGNDPADTGLFGGDDDIPFVYEGAPTRNTGRVTSHW
jgi:single-strand DNA-binding protein